MLGWPDGEAASLHGVICEFESHTEYQKELRQVAQSERAPPLKGGGRWFKSNSAV